MATQTSTDFWIQRWENNDIGFHEEQVNPRLVNHLDQLELPEGSRVLVPLCGKTVDIAWLLANGYRVAGAELSGLAIAQLFAELCIQPSVSTIGKLTLYSDICRRHFRCQSRADRYYRCHL